MFSGGSLRLSPLLAGAFFASAAPAQESTVIFKSLDNLEKRIVKMEAETAKMKKSGGAVAPEKSASHLDSSVILLSGRLDSLLLRLKALESASPAEKPSPSTQAAPAAAAAPDTTAQAAGAELARQIGALTTLLRQERSAREGMTGAPEKAPRSAPASTPAAASAAPTAALAPVSGLELKGDIQIQGERKFSAQSQRDNLDDFWGRLNFGAEYSVGDFQSKLNIRIFPEGFGFEPLTGATFDTVGQGALKVQSQPSSRIVINHAWAKYALGVAKLKVGRFETVETQSDNFGNYVDLGTAGKFMSRPAVHNALEVSLPLGPVSGSAILATNDRKLNRGFLRLYGKYAPVPDLALAAGYRANLFDRFKYPDDEILQRYDANIAWKSPIGWKAFAEAAILQAPGRGDEKPVLLGIQPKTGKALDVLSLEAEFLADRKAAGKAKEWLFNLHARKALGRFKLDAGCYSDPADADWNAVSLGLRMTSNIK
ncbi:MAG TPA: hypothetical protein VJ385_22250 [Fibrobacteria bacterium]|nr:hypothetical protein [Fibrobacteria bacterium]